MTTRVDFEQNQAVPVSNPIARLITIVFTIVFLLSGVLLGYLLYNAVKETVAGTDIPSLPYIDLTLPVVGNPEVPVVGIMPTRGGEIPVTGITGVPLPDYEQQERVNILLLGIDKRPDERYARTDTMILVTVDPENKTAGMVSIPRDLYVEIPGYWESRINTAHYLGDKNKYPGGGPALAMKTIQDRLGIPVHFYVKVDFDGFVKTVDTLGGIQVEVPRTIDDPTFPDQNYGYDPFYLEAGTQQLDGLTALKYARTRHSDSDFGRAARQQQVLVAIKDKALQLGIIPKIPELWASMAGAVETDLQLVDIVELAALADEVDPGNIQSLVLNENYTVDYTTEQGAMVLLPVWEKINPVIDEMFAAIEPQGPSQAEILAAQAAAEARQSELAQQEAQRTAIRNQLLTEGAKVVIQNGTPTDGLDAETALFLKEQGFDIIQFSPADTRNYPQTVIVDYTGKEYTLGTLVNFFGVAPENIRRSTNLKSDIDIRVIIGADFKLPENPEKAQSGPSLITVN